MIMERCKDVIPDRFRFTRGVVDSPDFPLNISRETLQSGRQLRSSRRTLKRRSNESAASWTRSPRTMKVLTAPSPPSRQVRHRPESGRKEGPVNRPFDAFYSSKEGACPAARVQGQDAQDREAQIPTTLAPTPSSAPRRCPQAEQVRAKGYEILDCTDDVDDFWIMRRLEESTAASLQRDHAINPASRPRRRSRTSRKAGGRTGNCSLRQGVPAIR